MTTNIIWFLQLSVYLIITSQLLFYIVILSGAMKRISLENFLELRKVIDSLMSSRFRVIYYAALILTLTVIILLSKEPDSILFITSCIALVCLVVDVTLAMKRNVPINNLINSHTPENTTHDWSALRAEWLLFINIRGGFITIGMLSQIAGLLWTSK